MDPKRYPMDSPEMYLPAPPRPHFQRSLQAEVPAFQAHAGPNTVAGKALSDLIYESLKSQADPPGAPVAPGPLGLSPSQADQAEVAHGAAMDGMEQPETIKASKEGDSDPLARDVVAQDAPEASSPEACQAEEGQAVEELQGSQMPVEPVQVEERHDHEDSESARIEKEIEVSTEPGPVDPVSYPTLPGPTEAAGESVDDARLPVEDVEAPAAGLGDQLHLTELKQSSATSEQEPKESCVYPASSMLQMRLTMPSKGECLGFKVTHVKDVLPRREEVKRERGERGAKAEKKKKSQAVETDVTCLTVKSLKSVLFQALSSQNRLEKRGEFKIAGVKTLRAMDVLLEQMRDGVRGHIEPQAARSIQKQWRLHKRQVESKKRQAKREAEGKANKEELQETMRKLAEQRQQEQTKPVKAKPQGPARHLAVALSQAAASSSTSPLVDVSSSDDETLGKAEPDPEAAPGLVPQEEGKADGKILMELLSPKGSRDEARKSDDEADALSKRTEPQQLTEGRLEGKAILEQIVPPAVESPLPARFFGELETLPIPTRASASAASAGSECGSALSDEREQHREVLRAQMRALAEARQVEEAKSKRRLAMKQLRQKVGPRPADQTLHGLLSRCDGDVNRAATAFWNGLPYA